MSQLPFEVTQVHLENYRGFLTIDASLQGTTVAIAPNGAGKSSLLGGLVHALANIVSSYGGEVPRLETGDSRRELHDQVFDECWPIEARVEIIATGSFEGLPATWGRRFRDFYNSEPLQSHNPVPNASEFLLVRAYPSPRRVTAGSVATEIAKVMATNLPRSAGYERWWDAEPNMSSVAAWVLRQQMLGEAGQHSLALFESALVNSRMLNGVHFDVSANALIAVLPTGVNVRAEDLSEGQRAVLAIIGDLFFRASQLNPQKDPSFIAGAVLIDEIDEHLHPGAAQIFLPTLMRAFPNLQWIVSSHSPQVWQSAPEGSVHIVSIGSDGKGSLEQQDYTEGAEVQVLLGRVGVEDRPPESSVAKLIAEFEAHLDSGTESNDQAARIFQQLSDLTGGKDPELLRLRGAAKLAEYRRAKAK